MTIKSIVTKSLICSAVALATVGSASANYGCTYRAAWNEIQDRYCLQGTDFGYPGSGLVGHSMVNTRRSQ